MRICRDSGDNKFLNCAIIGGANYLVSGDDSLKETEIYVALLGEKIVATGSLCEGRIKSFFVNPLHHKKGIGAKLVKYLEGVLKKKGYSSVFLRSSKYAVGFYKKLGYKEIEKICPPEVGEITIMKKMIK